MMLMMIWWRWTIRMGIDAESSTIFCMSSLNFDLIRAPRSHPSFAIMVHWIRIEHMLIHHHHRLLRILFFFPPQFDLNTGGGGVSSLLLAVAENCGSRICNRWHGKLYVKQLKGHPNFQSGSAVSIFSTNIGYYKLTPFWMTIPLISALFRVSLTAQWSDKRGVIYMLKIYLWSKPQKSAQGIRSLLPRSYQTWN